MELGTLKDAPYRNSGQLQRRESLGSQSSPRTPKARPTPSTSSGRQTPRAEAPTAALKTHHRDLYTARFIWQSACCRSQCRASLAQPSRVGIIGLLHPHYVRSRAVCSDDGPGGACMEPARPLPQGELWLSEFPSTPGPRRAPRRMGLRTSTAALNHQGRRRTTLRLAHASRWGK